MKTYFFSQITGPDLRFDSDLTHPDLNVAEEGRRLTNADLLLGYIDKQMEIFRGIRGVVLVSRIRSTVLKLAVMAIMKKKASQGETLLEISLSSRDNVDSMEHDFAITLTQCLEQKICLIVKKKGILYHEYIVARNYKDSSFAASIYIIVSASGRINSITGAFSGNTTRTVLLRRFTDEEDMIEQDLWPVYGVFNPDTATVVMSVLGSQDNDAVFQKRTCHKNVYISSDGRAISNTKFDSNFHAGSISAKQLYRGALGDMSFHYDRLDDDNKAYYFAVEVSGKVTVDMVTEFDPIFEIGFGNKDMVTKHRVLKHHGKAWVFYFARCRSIFERLCLTFVDRGNATKKFQESVFEEEREFSYTFPIIVNPNRGYIGVYCPAIRGLNLVAHEFTDVDFSSPLYPIFGIIDKAYIELKLLTRDEVTKINLHPDFGVSPRCGG